jgi:hypothetical protein
LGDDEGVRNIKNKRRSVHLDAQSVQNKEHDLNDPSIDSSDDSGVGDESIQERRECVYSLRTPDSAGDAIEGSAIVAKIIYEDGYCKIGMAEV